MRFLIYFIFIMLLVSSCETSHTQSKVILNNSDYYFELHTTNFYENDSTIYISPGQLIYLSSFQKLGNHPNSLPTTPCSIHLDIEFNIICNGYVFIGDFYDEYNWEESFDPGRASHQHCRYTVNNDHFQLLDF